MSTHHRILRRVRRGIAAATVLLCAGALAACASEPAASPSSTPTASASDGAVMRVAYLSTANYLTTVRNTKLMQTSLAKAGATVSFDGPLIPVNGLNTVTSGHADATSTGTGVFVNLIAQGQPWVAFALEKYSGDSQGIVAAPGSGITSLQDLYGKTIGTDRKGATGDYIIHQAFAQAGLDVSKVNIQYLQSPENYSSAFRSGKIDALSTFDQSLAMALSTPGAKELVNGSQLHSLNWTIHLVSKDFAAQHPAAVKAAYQALRQEAARAKKNPDIIYNAYREFGAPDDLIAKIKTFDVPTIQPMDAKAVSDLKKQAQQYVDFGFIAQAPDFTGTVIDGSK
jgi:sulfonate transport system substrate-binding protein